MIDQSNLSVLSGLCGNLKRIAGTNGGEYAGPCPMCGGEDRFHVQPHAANGGAWFCSYCTGRPAEGQPWHDTIDFICHRDNCDVSAALRTLGIKGKAPEKTTAPPPPPQPPRAKSWPALTSDAWQLAASAFLDAAQQRLWTDAGARALAWLYGRGLTEGTILAAGLGYNDRELREDWGLEEPVRLDRGIVIPWWIESRLWRINIRRPVEKPAKNDPKYRGPAGFANGLYNADALKPGCIAVLVEGEFDALSLRQVAGDLMAPVATGSTGTARLTRWLVRLALCDAVLVAFDTDQAGEDAAAWWLARLDNARRLAPTAHDANAMLQAGHDLRAWLGLEMVEA